jgi:hypothetical protein
MKRRRQSEKQMWRTAVHEAGHAVAACVLELKFQFARVYPEGKVIKEWCKQPDGGLRREEVSVLRGVVWGTGGGLRAIYRRVKEGKRPTEKMRDLLRRKLAMSFAGPLAEKAVTGRFDHLGAEGDYANVRVWTGWLDDDDGSEAVGAGAQASRLVYENFEWIVAVATRLLDGKALTQAQVREMGTAYIRVTPQRISDITAPGRLRREEPESTCYLVRSELDRFVSDRGRS